MKQILVLLSIVLTLSANGQKANKFKPQIRYVTTLKSATKDEKGKGYQMYFTASNGHVDTVHQSCPSFRTMNRNIGYKYFIFIDTVNSYCKTVLIH